MIYQLKKAIKKILPPAVLRLYHLGLAFGGALLYGFPARRMVVIGVTGTKGKSTVVSLLHEILRDANLGVASISSVRFKINDREWSNELKMTMPGRFGIQSFFRQALQENCHYAILEVTSEGIKQYRHRFIDFQVAVFTNLEPEHIESHGSFENYKQAKGELFELLKGNKKSVSVINLDDRHADYFLSFNAGQKYGYSLSSPRAKMTGQNISIIETSDYRPANWGSEFKIKGQSIHLNLLGQFNIYNALAATSAALALGVDLKTIGVALSKIKAMPGRMETVIGQPFSVIVDYAHTPDSLEKAYEAVKSITGAGRRIIGVLGAAGGGRDKWKRSEMGKLATQYCDYIILTDEDPYDEDPKQILSEIKAAIIDQTFPLANLWEILDRRLAIAKALELAQEGDVVIITGKGSELWMCLANGKKIPWSDKKIILEELDKTKKQHY